VLGHSLWDWSYYRPRRVVSGSYALFCLTLDAIVAVIVLVAAFTEASCVARRAVKVRRRL